MKHFNFKLILVLSITFCCGAFVQKAFDNQSITVEIIKNAEKLIGLDFTQAEADSMRDDLSSKLKNYEALRKINIPNEVAPILHFDPITPEFVPETGKSSFVPSTIGKVELPKNRDELAFYSVRQLAELIRTKQISSLELTQFFIARLKKFDPQLHCVITLTEDLALKQAATADAEIKAGKYRGILHGIPYGAKDLLAKKGYKTTWGSVPYKDQTIDLDATVIQKLENAGAILVAKTTLGELAWGDVWFGEKTRNPWNTQRGSSGSSAGSASAVSAGLIPFGIGTETYGSIVSPSSECGDTGLRPTFGRISKHGAMALTWSMDKIGPIARTVEDCAVVFNAIFGPDGKDLTVKDLPFKYNGNDKLAGIRIGYVKKDFDRNYPNKKTDSLTLLKLQELGAKLISMDLPDYPVSDMTFIVSVEGAAAFDDLTRSGKDDLMVRQIKNAWPNSFRASRFVPAVEYLQANRLRTLVIEEMEKTLKNIDVYLSPSFSKNLPLTNLTGHPCVVLPNGFRENGLPTSITFMGKLYGESKVLTVAKAYQDATNFHLKHPSGY
jgi:Asp-tRNA(Asn)/Glu-tRNA(Gln) amidotransferase A subunit family amidase